ncbi:YncE family protein [uncultured Sphingomonas sp.]|uniref:YncE family protein n=1 Tax=uncultured Sphingomonas sp. TaxID=158754 RepID=UPI0035C9DEBD
MILLSSVALLLAAAAPASAPTYRVAGSIAGPDGSGWDYAAVDPDRHHLYVTHGDTVTDVDLAQANAVRSIGAIQHGHSVIPVPGTGTLLVTSGRDNTVRLLDEASGAETARLAAGDDPDAATYDPATRHVLVMNAHGGSVSEVDVAGRRIIRTIPVKPALEEGVIGRGRRLFINDEDANEIEVVDLSTGKLEAPIPLTGCERPTGLAYDASHDRLISACANGKAAVVDAGRRQVSGLVDIAPGPDAALLDERRGVVLIPCGKAGVLEVLSLGGTVTKIATVQTEPGARTGALDPSTGAVYLPTARLGAPATPGGRPVGLPGTFHFVVVRPS